MTTSIQTRSPALLPTSQETLDKLALVHEALRKCDDVQITTEHLLHGGMYARTLRLGPGEVSLGSLIKEPTVLIIHGPLSCLVGDEWIDMEGYNVIAGCAGRKQLVVTHGYVEMTMIFPTRATTVEEAENEIFAEAHLLMSRRDGSSDTVTITGE